MPHKKSSLISEKRSGELLHTKHAFPPNTLGYCGPDVRGKISEYLHGSSDGESLLSILTKFEAAYPFVKMIAKSTGRNPFDYEVTEAYWIGNSLLDLVEPQNFFEFSYGDLTKSRQMASKRDGIRKAEVKSLFKRVGEIARPHHTFYVLGMYARSSEISGKSEKLLELMDSCRISWGKVIEVKRDTLVVERPPLMLAAEGLRLGQAKKQVIRYDPEIPPFSSLRSGDTVSIHWNFASEKLKPSQTRNLKRYTALDILAANKVAAIS